MQPPRSQLLSSANFGGMHFTLWTVDCLPAEALAQEGRPWTITTHFRFPALHPVILPGWSNKLCGRQPKPYFWCQIERYDRCHDQQKKNSRCDRDRSGHHHWCLYRFIRYKPLIPPAFQVSSSWSAGLDAFQDFRKIHCIIA
jgi:hypothetical protein